MHINIYAIFTKVILEVAYKLNKLANILVLAKLTRVSGECNYS